jgi:hypothetical protein
MAWAYYKGNLNYWQYLLLVGYADVINTTTTHTVEYVRRQKKLSPFLSSELNRRNGITDGYRWGINFDNSQFGGVTLYLANGNSYIGIVKNSKAKVDVRDVSGRLIKIRVMHGDLLAHEVLGHALSNAHGSSFHRYEDAIGFSNIFLTSRGLDYWSDGTGHDQDVSPLIPFAQAYFYPPYYANYSVTWEAVTHSEFEIWLWYNMLKK